MSTVANPSFETTLRVRDTCLCLHMQRAARALARRFDDALRPLGLTNGQFSLMMSLNRPEPPGMAAVASLLAMDRTTLTAALKPLAAPRSGQNYSEPGRPPRPPDDADGKGTKTARTSRSDLGEYPSRGGGSALRPRPRGPPEQSARTLVIVERVSVHPSIESE